MSRAKQQSAPDTRAAHGLTAGPIVLPTESQALFDELRMSYYDHYRPSTAMEVDLIEEMAACRWRLRRLSCLETAILTQACEAQMERLGENADIDIAMGLALVDVAENSKAWRMMERLQHTLRRSYEKAHKELVTLGEELVAADSATAEENGIETPVQIDYRAVLANAGFVDVVLQSRVDGVPSVNKAKTRPATPTPPQPGTDEIPDKPPLRAFAA